MKPTLLVLAAGMGSRYGGLKQIDPIGPFNAILLDYAVYDALQSGFGRVILVIRNDLKDDFEHMVAGSFGKHIKVDYAFQELDDLTDDFAATPERTKPWGTAHAVRAARHLIDEPFVVINADDFYGRDAFAQLSRFLGKSKDKKPGEFAMAAYRLDQTLSPNGSVARGICGIAPDGKLISMDEHTTIARVGSKIESQMPEGKLQLEPTTRVSMNTWGFTPVLFELIEPLFAQWLRDFGDDPKAEWYISTVVDTLIKSGAASVQVLPTDSSWFGVTYRDDRERTTVEINRLIQEGVYPENLWG